MSIMRTAEVTCPECGGTGRAPGRPEERCSHCRGTGRVQRRVRQTEE